MSQDNYEIKVTITPEGEIESEVIGVVGPECEKLTAWMDELGEVTDFKKKPEYNRKQSRTTSTRIRA